MESLVVNQHPLPRDTAVLLSEARTLRDTLRDLRTRLEQVQRNAVDKRIEDGGNNDDRVNVAAAEQEDVNDETSSDKDVLEQVTQEDESKSTSTASEATVSQSQDDAMTSSRQDEVEQGVESKPGAQGAARIREATVAIIGEMAGKGLRAADTLVRCGLRKLILFDENDASDRIEQSRIQWEEEENPSFELEAYVSAYEMNEDSYEHFLDRLMTGGSDDRPVDLIILSNCENVSAATFHLLSKATSTINSPLVYSHNSAIFVLEPTGNEFQIEEANTTLAMAALQFLLA